MDFCLSAEVASEMLMAKLLGTSVQRNIIGERLLGLPRDPRPAGQ